MAERIGKEDFSEKVLNFPGLSVVEFYTDSCVPCKRMSPILTALGEQYSEGVFIAKVNAAFESELAEEYDIAATPTFLLFKNGGIVERFTGARKKEELEQIIEENR
ncbi:MAG: thioredoxin family protein [Lachnospiraceae bacterium]|nr:thioredoxin family protein [Lachnospiraceae bacterium]